ncbi:MAG TPA: hypothetical protein VMZ29_00355 [Candidatus Bathyarchaeia archaeon]|nr:hypothetical protein [Candidatus Bathyarchaeia archaeon]
MIRKEILKMIFILGVVVGLTDLACIALSEPVLESNVVFSETFDDNDFSDWKLKGNSTDVESSIRNDYLQLDFDEEGYCSYSLNRNFTDFECYFDAKLSISDMKGITGIGCSFYNSTDDIVCGFTYYLADTSIMFDQLGEFPVYKIGTSRSDKFYSISEKVSESENTYIPHILETGTLHTASTLSYYQIKIIVQNSDTDFTAKYDDIFLVKDFTINAGPTYLFVSLSLITILSAIYILNKRYSNKK